MSTEPRKGCWAGEAHPAPTPRNPAPHPTHAPNNDNHPTALPLLSSSQIKCGDQFADGAVSTFNACAISQKQCVPQRVDEGVFPVPPDCAVDNKFDLDAFQGRWCARRRGGPVG